MLEFAVPVLVGGGVLWLAYLQHSRRLRGWQDAVEACGLDVVEGSVWRRKLTARTRQVEVRIEVSGGGEEGGESTRIIVSIPGPPGFSSMTIRRKPLLRRGQEIKTGDDSLDGTFLLEGPMPQVLALLDSKTRGLLAEANTEGRLELSASDLRVEKLSDDMVPYVLRLLLDISQRFMEATDVPRLLAENARRDPDPGVRLRNLLGLVGERPGGPETIEALRTACADSSPEVRLRAAQALGAEGGGVLLELAEGLEDDAVSAEAVTFLDRVLTFERTKAILDQALERRCLQTARVCLEALGRSGDTAAEAPLLQTLQREEADLRIAAATALGRAGSVAAVLPLQEAAERSWLDLEVRRAARQAIAEIQSRLQGASPGQLSLADSEAGQLSIAPAEAGQLSLTQDEPPPRAREAPDGRRA